MERDGVLQTCEEWRKRTVKEGILEDVYDGNVWKSFMHYNSEPFVTRFDKTVHLGLIMDLR